MKTLWLTSVGSSEETVKNIVSQLQPYGLEVKGHFWEDDLEKMAWSKPRNELLKAEVAMWLIAASNQELSTPSVRYGLALLGAMVQARRGLAFPIVALLTQGEMPSSETLPTPLRGADLLSLADSAVGAKLVARIHSPLKEIASDYRMDVYANPHIGQWLEVGPNNTPWSGAMLGVTGAEVTAHAVGPKGSLPDKAVLNYPLQGMKLTMGETEYAAWAVQNEISPETSYFVKLEGFPESIIFGPYSSEGEAEVYVVGLK